MEPQVPHVTGFFARAPSSLLFCGVRNTHKYLAFCKFSEEFGELELIQTQMTQKPMLRAEVYARALRASQNRKEDSL